MKQSKPSADTWSVTITLLIAVGILWGTLSPPVQEQTTFSYTDKIQHAAAFALLIFPMAYVRLRRAVLLAPAALAFGGMIELVQPLVGRGAEWGDLLADGIGIAIGLGLAWVIARIRPRVQAHSDAGSKP